MNTCENCKYRVEMRQGHEIQKQSICNRYPPTPYPIPQQGGVAVMSLYPVINDAQTCGEFVQIKEPFKLA